MGRLLERDSELARLHGWLIEAVAGHGRTAFVGGEAGIGKSALVSELARSAPPAVRVAVGRCDALQTPRVLGPFLEVASALGLDTMPDRDALLATLLGALRDGPPTLAVIEDAHWADDTTIELIALLGRRAVDLPLLLVVTYREAEVTADHPLRLVLGDLASASGAVWLGLQPLSLAAVRELAAGTDIPAEEIHQRTGGNPFFVTEALATPAAAVPTSVRLAVLARAGRLRRRRGTCSTPSPSCPAGPNRGWWSSCAIPRPGRSTPASAVACSLPRTACTRSVTNWRGWSSSST